MLKVVKDSGFENLIQSPHTGVHVLKSNLQVLMLHVLLYTLVAEDKK